MGLQPMLQPAALPGDQYGLRAVDGAELAVDVVEVRAHGARREPELERDLLVDLALRQALEHVQLARRQRTRSRRAPVVRGRTGKLEQHLAQVLRAEAD